MMNCDKYESLISLYLEEELETEERIEFEQHVNGCESCKRQLDALRFMKSMTPDVQEPVMQTGRIKRKIYAKIYRDLLIMFAGLVIIVSVVAISGGLAQMFLLSKTSAAVSGIFITGILLMLLGLIIFMYDMIVDIFKLVIKK